MSFEKEGQEDMPGAPPGVSKPLRSLADGHDGRGSPTDAKDPPRGRAPRPNEESDASDGSVGSLRPSRAALARAWSTAGTGGLGGSTTGLCP